MTRTTLLAATGLALLSLAPRGALAESVSYMCDYGATLSVTFENEEARVTRDGQTAILLQQRMASGFAYEDAQHRLTGKGQDAEFTDAAGRAWNCREEAVALAGPQITAGETETAVTAETALSGTRWRLQQFQSSDDAIGTRLPPPGEDYLMTFDADGNLPMRLGCNSMNGHWTITSATSEGGQIEMGDGPMTRAFCGPDAMDTQIAADLQHIRSYLIEGDLLHMALQADGGIYTWQRVKD